MRRFGKTLSAGKAGLFLWVVLAGILQARDGVAGQTLYSYDTLGRLTQVVSDNGSVDNYRYDSAGNRTQTETQNVIKYLHPDESLCSPDGHTCLIMQGDGNLVLYTDGVARWSSQTNGTSSNLMAMQSDGNLVVYGGKPYWDSGAWGNPGSSLSVTDDGAATITSAKDIPIWSTNTGKALVLNVDKSITSPDGRFRLLMQADGNLVLYQGDSALWSSQTNGTGANFAAFGLDCRLAVYQGGASLWSSGAPSVAGCNLALQNDGNLVIYSPSGSPVWTSNTSGH